jgi:N-hydroxyarylamine O-acetyltransferase
VDIEAYLDRIGYRGPRTATLDTLRSLHRAHLLTVPFENLDIHAGPPIVLDEERLYDKIVRRRRGGFCYELNGLFAMLLGEMGFCVSLLSAGVAHDAGGFGPEFDHLALRLDLDGEWLADVGFGESILDPVPFHQPGLGEYRLEADGSAWTLFREQRPRYRFTLQPRDLADFAGMCVYHQTSRESHFTQGRIITQATAEGRVTLSDTRLIATRGVHREEHPVSWPAEFAALCQQYFGICIPPAASTLPCGK